MPDLSNDFYLKHGQLLCSSYAHWTNKKLITNNKDTETSIIALYKAPFAVVSHGIENDPIFNFGNKTALKLFELKWDRFIQTPSRESVEMTSRKEREKLMACVTANGFMDNYSGVRVSSSGKRFLIEDATIWNIVDINDVYYGQAAMFEKWTMLD
jgi:hypothetical protein